jgi:hypothetical protein
MVHSFPIRDYYVVKTLLFGENEGPWFIRQAVGAEELRLAGLKYSTR